ncbi:Aspartyl/Asparaginyl beta-hydroxylase [Seminavis robusta]|uniref:Aspartyl/Asparaginyl beta-hydroxylase n=1 Tax=Seminavis robusta TaxID=568900 RepID=A0A9N8H794_9STRA|nr:Aspartyl/Asparaginyl beta-hydroxylase [Seminavis robusta]|eukprot:Sro196_g083680.1 Aspartyl/Asparaginyl beta-hydroxylase (601) ;mRNA; f:87896-89698
MSEVQKKGFELCRFEDALAPIVLNHDHAKEVVVVGCDELEDGLDEALDAMEEFPVDYPQQEDALLLHCRFPRPIQSKTSVKSLLQEASPSRSQDSQDNPKEDNGEEPLASITGIPEEFGATAGTPKIHVHLWTGTVASSKPNTCKCQAAHSEWKRQSLQQNHATQLSSEQQQAQSVELQWVDLRQCGPGPLLFPSLTSVAHFYRSLMGTSHQSSPWWQQEDDDKDYKTLHTTFSHHNPHNRIAVLLDGEVSDFLLDIRVADICPSWSLYSVSQVKVAPTWQPWQAATPDTNLTTTTKAATLVIFKPLPPRPLLTLAKPSSNKIEMDETHLTELPEGCLWEMYLEYKDEDDNEKNDKDNIEEKKTTVRKVPHCRMTAPPYVSYKQDFDMALLQPLLDNWKVVRDEALQIPQWTAWPETQHYSKARSRQDVDDDQDGISEEEPFHPSWNVFPLCHCFPANQPENKQWIDKTCAFVPRTVELLRAMNPLVRTALFSRLDPETTLEAHTGWSDLANHVLRCHLSLVVPDGEVCGTWVDGCVATHKEGQFLCFDDSKTHRAFNYHKSQERIVLILDLARPDNLPIGTATGGHSDELDQFIAQMNV